MTRRPPAVVIGGGVGGLSTAIRLQAAGHQVTVVERNDVVGGKLATYERDGYTFDIGPSLITLPHLLDETFRAAGTSLGDELDLVRLDPQFRYHWRDDDRRGAGTLTLPDGADAKEAAFEAFSEGAGAQWREFDERGKTIWDISERTFFAGPMGNALQMLKRMQSPRDLLDIDANRTLWDRGPPHLRRPAPPPVGGPVCHVLGVVTARGAGDAVVHPPRPSRSTAAGTRWAASVHWPMRTSVWRPGSASRSSPVPTSCRSPRPCSVSPASSWPTARTSTVRSSWPTSTPVTSTPTCSPGQRELNRVQRASRSTSGFVLCLGVRDTTPDLAHHNVWFSGDFLHEFRQIANGELADDPTIYACVSSVTDPSQAPSEEEGGGENWFVLVNTPPGVEVDSQDYRDVVLARLAQHGVDLRRRLRFAAHLTPADIESRYRSPGGAIYGTSSNGRKRCVPSPRQPRAGRWALPRRRFEPSRRRPAPRVDQRPNRQRPRRRRPVLTSPPCPTPSRPFS